MRTDFTLPDCDAHAPSLRWARRYSRDPAGFSASLKRAMPLLLFVLDQVQKRDIPAEFALLPYVESTYNPTASNGGRAMGMWQLMPATALGGGLTISRNFDQRLDPVASTRVALNLLARHHRAFHDWRLADMAFNAGSHRIRRALSNTSAQHSPPRPDDLGLEAMTLNHLAKLQALACIVSHPHRFGVTLPVAGENDVLAVLKLRSPVDLRLAARLSGLNDAQIKRLNPEYKNSRMPGAGPFRLLLPVAARDALIANLEPLPVSIRAQWRELRLQRSERLSVLAYANAIEPEYLAQANRVPVDAQLSRGSRVLLPDHSVDPARRHSAVTSRNTSRPRNRRYVVHRGDTLWTIARRSGVIVDDLCQWNGLDEHAALRPGQHLRLQAPDNDTMSGSNDVASD